MAFQFTSSGLVIEVAYAWVIDWATNRCQPSTLQSLCAVWWKNWRKPRGPSVLRSHIIRHRCLRSNGTVLSCVLLDWNGQIRWPTFIAGFAVFWLVTSFPTGHDKWSWSWCTIDNHTTNILVVATEYILVNETFQTHWWRKKWVNMLEMDTSTMLILTILHIGSTSILFLCNSF